MHTEAQKVGVASPQGRAENRSRVQSQVLGTGTQFSPPSLQIARTGCLSVWVPHEHLAAHKLLLGTASPWVSDVHTCSVGKLTQCRWEKCLQGIFHAKVLSGSDVQG